MRKTSSRLVLRRFHPKAKAPIQERGILIPSEARIVACNANCMTHPNGRISSLLLSSQPSRLTSFCFVERPLNRPLVERSGIIVALRPDPPGSGLRRDKQIPAHQGHRGGVAKFHHSFLTIEYYRDYVREFRETNAIGLSTIRTSD
ncbi:MAG TPA: hypothetical protein VNE82_13155 [Candidatus Binataceae bacterium]|nr:hypothetical protein [Candidatus Binataceae bacterium]